MANILLTNFCTAMFDYFKNMFCLKDLTCFVVCEKVKMRHANTVRMPDFRVPEMKDDGPPSLFTL